MGNKLFKYNSNLGHLSPETIKWIGEINGQINAARKNPSYNLKGYNPEFWQRLKEKTIRTIDVNGLPSSHLLSYGTIGEGKDLKYVIFPLVHLDKNGKLYYNPDMEHALLNNNFIYAPNEEIARDFTEHYKQSESFPGFLQFNPVKKQLYWNAILDNFPKIKLIYQALLKKGYSSELIAGILGNLVIESQLDEFKNEGNGGHGYGLVLWTDDTRKNNLNNYSTNFYKSEFERLLDFMLEELLDKKTWHNAKTNKTKFELQKIPYRNVSTATATRTFMNGYENPLRNASHYDDRLLAANYILSPEFLAKLKSDLIDYNSSIINPTFKVGGKINYFKFFK